ncbi:hypothetical protein L218DRAFT_945082 [Marasmius fiardii PR-910]|nr:hypothetical protein L218DRAFT_945082 [Marasmius fiardii PR-910]
MLFALLKDWLPEKFMWDAESKNDILAKPKVDEGERLSRTRFVAALHQRDASRSSSTSLSLHPSYRSLPCKLELRIVLKGNQYLKTKAEQDSGGYWRMGGTRSVLQQGGRLVDLKLQVPSSSLQSIRSPPLPSSTTAFSSPITFDGNPFIIATPYLPEPQPSRIQPNPETQSAVKDTQRPQEPFDNTVTRLPCQFRKQKDPPDNFGPSRPRSSRPTAETRLFRKRDIHHHRKGGFGSPPEPTLIEPKYPIVVTFPIKIPQ